MICKRYLRSDIRIAVMILFGKQYGIVFVRIFDIDVYRTFCRHKTSIVFLNIVKALLKKSQHFFISFGHFFAAAGGVKIWGAQLSVCLPHF